MPWLPPIAQIGRGNSLGEWLRQSNTQFTERLQKTPASDEAKEVKRRCREAGIIVGVGGSLGNVVRLQPPLVLTEDEATEVADKVTTSLKQVNRSL